MKLMRRISSLVCIFFYSFPLFSARDRDIEISRMAVIQAANESLAERHAEKNEHQWQDDRSPAFERDDYYREGRSEEMGSLIPPSSTYHYREQRDPAPYSADGTVTTCHTERDVTVKVWDHSTRGQDRFDYRAEYIDRYCIVTYPLREIASYPSEPKVTDRAQETSSKEAAKDSGFHRDHYEFKLEPEKNDPPPRQSSDDYHYSAHRPEPSLSIKIPLGLRDEFNTWSERKLQRVIARYSQLTVDAFEKMFLSGDIPSKERQPHHFYAIPEDQCRALFSCYNLYQFSHFREFLKRFPQCSDHIKAIKEQLRTDRAFFDRMWHLPNDTACPFNMTIDAFYRELVHHPPIARQWLEAQQRREECCQCMMSHQQAQEEKLRHLSHTYDRYLELYDNDAAIPIVSRWLARSQAMKESLANTFALKRSPPIVSDQTKSLLSSTDFFLLEEGSALQLHLQTEILAILDQVAVMHTRSTMNSLTAMQEGIQEFAVVANGFNNAGYSIQAIRWTDVAWSLLDYVHAVGEGMVIGACATVVAIADPIDTGINIIVGITTAGYTLARAIYDVVDADLTLLYDFDEGICKADKLFDHVGQWCGQIKKQYDAMPGREVVKHGVALFTEGYLTGKALGAVHAWNKAAQAEAAALGAVRHTPFEEIFIAPIAKIAEDAAQTLKHLKQRAKEVATSCIDEIPIGQQQIILAGEETLTLPTMIKSVEGECAASVSPTHQAMSTESVATGSAEVVETATKTLTCFIEEEHQIVDLIKKYSDGIPAPASVIQAINKTVLKITEQFLRHIFGLELKSVGDFKKLSGLHHDYLGQLEAKGIIKLVNKKVCPVTGIIEANVELYNGIVKGSKTTFFPPAWSREKVLEKICEGLNNVTKKPSWKDGNWYIKSEISDTFFIGYNFDIKGKLISAYPIIQS